MSRIILPIEHFEYDSEKTPEENTKDFAAHLQRYQDYCEEDLRIVWGGR